MSISPVHLPAFSGLPRMRHGTPFAPPPASRLPMLVALYGLAVPATFLLGAGLTVMIFRFWGLDFMLVASRADVVQAGLSLLFQLSPVLLVAGASAFTVYWPSGDGRKPFFYIAALALLGSLINAFLGEKFSWISLIGLTAVGGAFFPLLLRFTGKGQKRPMLVSDPSFLLLLGIWTLFLTLQTVSGPVESGYFGHRVRMVARAGGPASASGDVFCENWLIWRGERAMVVDCMAAKPMTQLKLIYGPSDFEALIDRPGRQPGWAGAAIDDERKRFTEARRLAAEAVKTEDASTKAR